jgi:hypothetical protein
MPEVPAEGPATALLSSAAALAEDLQRFLQGQVVAARPVSPFERPSRAAVARLREPAGPYLSYSTLGPAMETLSPHLHTAAAKRTAEAIEAIV